MKRKKLYTSDPTRDADILARHANGESVHTLAKEYGISPGKVRQIYTEQRASVYREDLNKIYNGAPFVYRVYVCSPLRADTPENVELNRANALAYEEAARKAVANLFYGGRLQQQILAQDISRPAFNVNVRAFAPHGHISTLLDDLYQCEREIALNTGLSVINVCDAIAIGGDVISSGMAGELMHAVKRNLPVFILDDPASANGESIFYKIVNTVDYGQPLRAYNLSGWGALETTAEIWAAQQEGVFRDEIYVARHSLKFNPEDMNQEPQIDLYKPADVLSSLMSEMLVNRRRRSVDLGTGDLRA